MPEFILDTSGHVGGQSRKANDGSWKIEPLNMVWRDLDAFTQGYIEALFFTSGEEPGQMRMGWLDSDDETLQTEGVDVGFADLAPETLAAILTDCAKFKAVTAELLEAAFQLDYTEAQAGRDFWYTRNGHGVGFWDRDELEPRGDEYERLTNITVNAGDDRDAWNAALAERDVLKAASLGQQLTDAAHEFGEVDVYLGDDGKVRIL